MTDRDAHGTETILFVDDEPGIRDLTVEYLTSRGYTVLSAENGDRALEVVCAHQGPIHALITDAIMPGIDGVTLARRLSELRPGIKVLYVSGYSGGPRVIEELIERGEAFMQKPFVLAVLLGKLREILG
jgi:two-component system cell cycle sensor histidine kinase/response regulator CckA